MVVRTSLTADDALLFTVLFSPEDLQAIDDPRKDWWISGLLNDRHEPERAFRVAGALLDRVPDPKTGLTVRDLSKRRVSARTRQRLERDAALAELSPLPSPSQTPRKSP